MKGVCFKGWQAVRRVRYSQLCVRDRVATRERADERHASPLQSLERATPVYRALAELGKALKTIFLCRYLKSIELRQEINEGLNVIENWNSANDFIYFGKGGEMASNRADDEEISMLSLHLVQLSIVYVNTLMIQQVLAEPAWRNPLNTQDLRGITALLYGHVDPYRSFRLDLNSRLPIDPPQFGPQSVGTQLLLSYNQHSG